MDNYTLRRPDPNGPMPMAMAADVDRATWGGRVAATLKLADALSMTGGLDVQQSRHRGRSGTDTNSYRNQSWEKDAEFSNVGLFSELTARLRTWPPDRRRARGPGFGQGLPSHLGPHDDDAQSHRRRAPRQHAAQRLPALRAGPGEPAGHWYVGLGHVQRFPDYWELFSPGRGPAGSVNAFDAIKPEKTTQLDVGMQYRGDKVDAWVSGYAGYVRTSSCSTTARAA